MGQEVSRRSGGVANHRRQYSENGILKIFYCGFLAVDSRDLDKQAVASVISVNIDMVNTNMHYFIYRKFHIQGISLDQKLTKTILALRIPPDIDPILVTRDVWSMTGA